MKEVTFQTKVSIHKGILDTESDTAGPEIEDCTCGNRPATDGTDHTSWCYLFIHNSKVNAFTEILSRDNIRHFIHKSVVYQRRKGTRGIQQKERPTVSGLVFLQGPVLALQSYLDERFPGRHLVNNCSTHRPAVIADSVMQPFMRVMETSPERIRFLLHPFKHYADGHTRLRLVSGLYAGLEGYVIRIDRDRRLVMNVGGMSVAISGIHCEKFEVVE